MARRKVTNPNQPLTDKQEAFVQNLLRGMSKKDAYIMAYPAARGGTVTNPNLNANRLLAKAHVRARYETLLAEHRERESVVTGWTREQSIHALQFVIDTNRKDLERIIEAGEQELEQLQKTLEEHPEEAQLVLAQMIKNKKKARANLVNNQGIISAVAELNKMQGFNEQNVNMTGVVSFSGDDQLED